jgi:6-phosphogluconolactonase (cycloisomerase 2 family)
MRARLSALLLIALAACSDRDPGALTAPASATARVAATPTPVGAVFVETNDASANEVVAFDRASDGTLQLAGRYATGGQGTGGTVDPLQSQYALVLSPNRKFLFAVNTASNSISSFQVDKGALALVATVAAGGEHPVSLAATNHVLYSLNSVSGTVTGFRIASDGRLAPVAGWSRSLSPGASGAAAIRFSHDGHLLAVAERLSQTIDVFGVEEDGSLTATPVSSHSAGLVPFGFDWTTRGQLVVSEAGTNSASSYDVARDGTLRVISASAVTLQRAPCWLIVTNDGRFAYTANAGTGNLTGFDVAADGALSLVTLSGITGDLGAGSTPLDLDLSRDSQFLYVLKAGTGTIGAFAVNGDGSLRSLPDTPALPPRSGQMGLAAY